MVQFHVCSKVESLSSKDICSIDLEDNGVDPTVGSLLTKVIQSLNLNPSEENYQLICYGKRLKNDKLLSFYGIKRNAVLYLYRQIKREPLRDTKPNGKGKKAKFDDQEITNMVVASRTALMNSAFREMLIKLQEKDFRDNLVQCTAGLKDDMVALGNFSQDPLLMHELIFSLTTAFLRDPELLSIMINDQKATERVLDRHPAILEALTYLATAFHEENASVMSRAPPTASGSGLAPGLGVSYSLDDLSDDEDMSGALVEGPPPDGQHVMSPTTASAFAHLINELRANRGTSTNSQGSRITTEMLRQALQFTNQPTNSLNPQSSANPSAQQGNTTNSQATPVEARPDYSAQLQQLRDLGINDVNLCLHALQITNGDVQAAANLIFSESFHQ